MKRLDLPTIVSIIPYAKSNISLELAHRPLVVPINNLTTLEP